MRGLARSLRRALVNLLGRTGVLNESRRYLESAYIRHAHSITNAPHAIFVAGTRVFNWRGDPSAISVGADSRICGDLLIYPSGGMIEIGRGCFLGEGSRIWSMERITIGDYVLMSIHVAIMDTDSHEMHPDERAISGVAMNTTGLLTEQGNIRSAPIVIGDHVWIGLGASILKGVSIGPRAIVAAGSVVTRDVPADVIVAGNPARIVRRLDTPPASAERADA